MQDQDALAEVFAEAAARARERDGMRITVTDGDVNRQFDLWPSRLTYAERQKLRAHTGVTPVDVGMAMHAGGGSIEMIAAIVAMSVYQTSGVLSDMDGVTAWLEGALFSDAELDVEALVFDEVDGGDEGNG